MAVPPPSLSTITIGLLAPLNEAQQYKLTNTRAIVSHGVSFKAAADVGAISVNALVVTCSSALGTLVNI